MKVWAVLYVPEAELERDGLVAREKAQVDPRAFAAACRRAEERLAKIEDER